MVLERRSQVNILYKLLILYSLFVTTSKYRLDLHCIAVLTFESIKRRKQYITTKAFIQFEIDF